MHGQLGDGTFTTSSPYCKLKPVRVLLSPGMGIDAIASKTPDHDPGSNVTSSVTSSATSSAAPWNMSDSIKVMGLITIITAILGGVIYLLKRR